MQADATLERTRSGLGIGLTLVKQLVEAHGGSVEMRSAGADRGSEVELILPVLRAAPEIGNAEPVIVEALVPRRILVVDDNQDAANTMALVLRMEGHDVRTCYEGATALTLAASWQPEVVLLDIGLPGMSGYDIARVIRSRDYGAEMFLVALTGLGQPDDRRRSQEAGFDAHLVKPVDSGQVEALLLTIPH